MTQTPTSDDQDYPIQYHSQAARDLVAAYLADPAAFEATKATRSPAIEALVAETLAAEATAQGADVVYRSPAMQQLVADYLANPEAFEAEHNPYLLRSAAAERLAAEATARVEQEQAERAIPRYHSQAMQQLVADYLANPKAFEATNATRSAAIEALVAETLAAEAAARIDAEAAAEPTRPGVATARAMAPKPGAGSA